MDGDRIAEIRGACNEGAPHWTKEQWEQACKELCEDREHLYRRVPLEDGQMLQFVGVHQLRWQREWGEPTVGFVEVDY
jgi:hypothetical protein